LFGTTLVGAKYGGGLLYKLTNNTWQQTFLHNFCNMPNCTDGQSPIGGVTIDGSGNLFGATMSGGAFDKGVAFEHHVGGGYNVIYHFCSLNNCSDGSGPEAGMVLDSSGNLYGTTVTGGKFNHGVLFKLHKDTFAQTVLYDFCKKANCVDGSSPLAVISDRAGHLFGVTRNGGKHNDGTVYQFTP
jgi:uncharacterized repeat protein (TIGR03803 family)